MIKVAFLGYGRSQSGLIDALERRGLDVWHSDEKLTDFSAFDCVISFGYRHIIKADALATLRRPIVNLHIAYLPYNRGAHPNFCSWIDGTPAGVTIHEIDAGVDTGPIIVQALADIDPADLTFRQSHAMLIDQIERLFVDNLDAIVTGHYRPVPQQGTGTVHRMRDLPDWMTDWDMAIGDACQRAAASIAAGPA